MATLIDSPEFTANEIYEMQQTDPVEGAAAGASFGGLGIDNQPHQQLANRTAFVKNRQDTNMANIAALQAFIAGFVGSLQPNGYVKIPVVDVAAGPRTLIIQWGYYALANFAIPNDEQYAVVFPIAFPNAILAPPIATNVYVRTGGGNTAASVVAWNTAGATFELDVAGALLTNGIVSTREVTGGFSWLAIGW